MPYPFATHPFLLSVQDVASQLDSSLDRGLTSTQVAQRQADYGRNELEVEEPTPWYSILLKQFCNAMIWVLVIVVAVSFGVGDPIEGGVVTAVIAINVSTGFYQEYRAEKKMDALRSLSSPSATVVRDGDARVIPNAEVVPGDVVLLRVGDTVPADLRLAEVVNLSCDEQMLTGEALPVDKVTHNRIVDPTTGATATAADSVTDGDRINLAFASTFVTKGRGRGLVVATGMDTAVGRITAATAQNKKKNKDPSRPSRSMNARKHGLRQPVVGGARRLGDLVLRLLGLTDCTPLQRRLTYLTYVLFLLAVVVALIVFAVHRFQLTAEVVLYATSTGIALIPESLAIVLIMAMVQAARVMRQANVVVRDLAALELLGGVTNICSDKTGTLTQGAMLVKKAWLPPPPPPPDSDGDGDGDGDGDSTGVLTLQGSSSPNDPTAGRVVVSKAKHAESGPEAPPAAARGIFEEDGEEKEPTAPLTPHLRTFLLSCALCNIATVRQDPNSGEWHAIGEPTEIALQVFAQRFGLGKHTLEDGGWRPRAEFPFDSSVKRMSVVYDAPADDPVGGSTSSGGRFVFTKGAVERILERCSRAHTSSSSTADDEAAVPMTDARKDEILAQMNALAPLGLRVLALAYRPLPGVSADPADGPEKGDEQEQQREDVEADLTFLGLAGIYDPPREETAQAIRECTEAGIRVHMLTGDHPATAEAIAREVGILPRTARLDGALLRTTGSAPRGGGGGALVMPAPVFDALSEAELDALPQLPRVVARCAPATKTRMIEALRRRPPGTAVSAMTGDGVNDAPSLRRADVGIAMGGAGSSDVAKAAAALVLTDDRFSSLVAAVRQGRRMFDNMQKFLLHLLVSNVGEVLLLVVGLALRDADGFSVFPVSALHILWINIFTSALPALGLGLEPAAPDVMHRPPRGRTLFTRELVADMLVYGVAQGAIALLTFVTVVYGAGGGGNLGHGCNEGWSPSCRTVFRARATVFVQLTYLILVSAWEFKHMRRSLLRLDPASPHRFPVNVAVDLWANKLLFFSVVGGLLPPIALVYIPVLNDRVLKHKPITWEWGLVLAGLVVFLLAVEAWKAAKRTLSLFPESVDVEGLADLGDEPAVQKTWTGSTRTLTD